MEEDAEKEMMEYREKKGEKNKGRRKIMWRKTRYRCSKRMRTK
jgi:hypothetical protein